LQIFRLYKRRARK